MLLSAYRFSLKLRRSRHIATALVLIAGVFLLSGCASPAIKGDAYTEQSPTLDIVGFFEGTVKAWGIVQNRKGNIIQRFTVDIEGTVNGDTLVLDEVFNYDFGEGPMTRRWELQRVESNENNEWTGSANDIASTATGAEHGNAFNWRYQMDLPRQGSDKTVRVVFDDWLWAMDDNTVVNRSYIKKFGITFAEVTIFMQKQSGPLVEAVDPVFPATDRSFATQSL